MVKNNNNQPDLDQEDLDVLSPVKRVETEATLSVNDLMKLLIQTQGELAKSQKELSEAILESRKPYVDPKVLAQKKQELEERRKQIERDQRIKIATKRICPHRRENGTLNVKWHEHSNGITKGMCGECFSEFDTRNPEDLALLRQDLKAIKNMGRAGGHARRGAILDQ
jgi:hypothetical protein